ncbi:MAG: putative N-succinyldiaminopimelate aminotransferase DapC [Syntrophaceae bacterium PtaU1.Bin231]|nr:MAG: putative N-succinyldiaminopimelate aminotransferase DapC [Syntrophaceae bacterium PtaU1.Bin231]HOG17078.1 aminotransferase class I/II-fold pyridoxal phosphate-dependent enzyme [Syntrophales bacterium]
MPRSVSVRESWVTQSEIRNMSIECARVGGINLSQGVCDTEVPEIVRRAACQAVEDGYNTYTRYDGLAELRDAISLKYRRFYGLATDPESEIVVSAGATGAFYCACLALLNPGDEVILFEPYYGYHVSTLIATEAVPVFVRVKNGTWTFSGEDLERAVTAKTRAVMVNTPANPSGKVFSREELETVADLAAKHDLFVFTDEIYEHFIYDGSTHVPPATLDGMRERTITISGLSKTFSITGWRIGYCICDARWARTIGYFNDLVYVCAPSPLQMASAKGVIQLDEGYYRELALAFRSKRDRICTALADANLRPHVPQGAYYVLADISALPGRGGKERVMYLLQETGVAAVPGEAFYAAGGSSLARFCFAKNDRELDEACDRLRRLTVR